MRTTLSKTWLGRFDKATLKSLEDHFVRCNLRKGEVLFRQGESGDCLYLVNAGALEVQIQDPEGTLSTVDLLGKGDFLGEIALLTGQPRTATVRAVRSTKLFKLKQADFEALCASTPGLYQAFVEYSSPRLQRTQLVNVLNGLFGSLDRETVHKLQKTCTWIQLRKGDSIHYMEEPAGSMYIVINGRLRIDMLEPGGRGRLFQELGRGGTIGEYNLLSGESEKMNLTAVRDTDLVRISQDAVESILENKPQAILQFSRKIAKGLRQHGREAGKGEISITTLALVPTQEGIELSEFAEKLMEGLAAYGASLHLSSARFDDRYGKIGAAQTDFDDPTNISIVSWLNEQEYKYTFILYECDPEDTAWTRRCLRQADRILLVGRADGQPGWGKLEYVMEELCCLAEQELVILHPAGTENPVGTKPWLNDRSLRAHHHILSSRHADYPYLARRLVGREVGLVLSGGGARGFAHAGVFKALEDSGIPVDLIGGSSMGALVGASLAQGDGLEAGLKFAKEYGSPRTLYDITLPAVSFMASHKLTRMLHGVFGDRQIEDLWRPYFCVSTDLMGAKAVVHQEGPVWEAVRCSLAIPGIFAPYLYNGTVMVDGGVMNNLPIDIMRDNTPRGYIIGVNVNPRREINTDFDFDSGVSGWQVMLDKINPFSKSNKVPSIFSILTRSVEVKGHYYMQMIEEMADFIIQPDVEAWNYLDFTKSQEIAEVGYQETISKLDKIKEDIHVKGFQLTGQA